MVILLFGPFTSLYILEKTRLPCLVAGRKVMFYGGSSNSVFIHYKTDKEVIQVVWAS